MTIVPEVGERCRIAFNRDEQRSRPTALPPRIQQFDERRAILPTDPVSGGTWIAVNDTGLAFAVLNVNPPLAASCLARLRKRRSRGGLIPNLIDCTTLEKAVERIQRLTPTDYPPFRLILLADGQFVELYSDGRLMRESLAEPILSPRFFTSSGLGDQLVEEPRRLLFESFFTPDGDWPSRQDAFHRHSWPNRTHLSVRMSRDDACTVSYTTIDLDASGATMAYRSGPPNRVGVPLIARLPLTLEVVR